MQLYDILMFAVFAGAILFGMWKGLAWQVASLAAIFVSYFVALNFSNRLTPYISVDEPLNRFAAMLILFIGSSLIIWLIYGYVRATIESWKLTGFDRQAGALLGALKGALLCMVITLFAVTLMGANIRRSVVDSKFGGYIATAINRLNAVVPAEIHVVLDPYVKDFNQAITETDQGFLQASEKAFDEKIQTFRGQFKFPDNRTARLPDSAETDAVDNATDSNSSQPSRRRANESDSNSGDWPDFNVRIRPQDIFDAARERLTGARDDAKKN
jgi:membrane protein required for colicin V production